MVSYVAGRDGPIGLAVTSDTGESIAPIPIGEIDLVSARGRAVSPNTQHKYLERLDKRFDLKTNGTFIVYARQAVGYPKPVEITSAKVRINIEN